MQTTSLGFSGIAVSRICLGTMTWGEQNTREDAFQQMDYALEHGVTFWDTAELYAVPPKAHTCGETEKIIGAYLAQNKGREKIVLASKVIGRGRSDLPGTHPNPHWIRDGQAKQDRANIMKAVEGSLQRLGTDYLDLYQLHWPDRPAQRFAVRDFYVMDDDMAPDGNYDALMLDIVQTMHELIQQGKIRSWGLSNDTAWAAMKYSWLADTHGLTKPVSVQNPYNFLDRRDDGALSEVVLRENIAYLPYSPLAQGVLSGKYLGGQWPDKARLSLFGKSSRYYNVNCEKATAAYVALAREHGIDPCQMALAFCLQQPFVTAPIIGATTMEQLKSDIASVDMVLSDEVMAAINAIHNDNPNPGP